MRRKRLRTYKRKKRYSLAAQTLGFVVLGTYGISQMSSSSYGLFTDQVQLTKQASTAFVFPKTVSDMVSNSQLSKNTASSLYSNAMQVLNQCQQSSDSSSIEALIQQLKQTAAQADTSANEAQQIANQLQGFSQEAQSEINGPAQSGLQAHALLAGNNAQVDPDVQSSAVDVKKYVDDGLNGAQGNASEASSDVTKIQDIINQANAILAKKKADEEAAAQAAAAKAAAEAAAKAAATQSPSTDQTSTAPTSTDTASKASSTVTNQPTTTTQTTPATQNDPTTDSAKSNTTPTTTDNSNTSNTMPTGSQTTAAPTSNASTNTTTTNSTDTPTTRTNVTNTAPPLSSTTGTGATPTTK